MVQLRLHVLAAVFLTAVLTTSSAAPMTESLLALLQNEPSLDNSDDNDIQRSLLDLSLQRALMQDEDEDEEESPDENQLLNLYLQQALTQGPSARAQFNWRNIGKSLVHHGVKAYLGHGGGQELAKEQFNWGGLAKHALHFVGRK